MNDNWNGKLAIVTGGSSGIGEAVARAIASAGGKVVITGRAEEKLRAVAEGDLNLLPIVADSADPASAEAIVEFALRHGTSIDFIVNNAGAGALRPIESYETEFILEQCYTNIIAPSLLLKAALPELRKSKGAVVNIGTAVSRNAAPMLAHYGATKSALEHLTRSWAMELAADGIRVNAVAPGPVKSGALTGMMGLDKEMAAQVERMETEQVPLGRRGVTEDLVPWILAFASSETHWTTGQILTVDGGWSQRNKG